MPFKKARCQLCGLEKHLTQVFPVAMLPAGLKAVAKTPLSQDGYVCLKDMHGLQAHYIQTVLEEAHTLFHALNPDATTPKDQSDVSATTLLQPPVDVPLTFGERVSDRIADFGGSWPFIGVFTGIIVVWITLNSWAIFRVGFDPYPYILLNLLLSCLAAIQAPIIMMSQNRQEKKDRTQSEHDYLVNLKAELEIRQLHTKIDILTTHQWEQMLEVLKTQSDMMGILMDKQGHPKS